VRSLSARLIALVALTLGACSSEVSRPNVLLITIDTLRADHVGCLGAPRGSTPTLDSLAATGVSFLQAHSPSNRTLPSHASILSSRHSRSHGVRGNADALPEGFSTMPEVVGRAGWSTCAVISMTFLRFVARGFQRLVEVDEREGLGLAGRTTEAAERCLRSAEEPFFLWVHYYDPHWPYEPPSPYDRLWWDREAPRLPPAITAALSQGRLSKEAEAFLRSQYRGEVAYTDRAVGDLLSSLKKLGLHERTLVIVTADHGESMTEHDLFFSHWEGLHQTLIHVPLILSGPGVTRGQPVETPVSLVDLGPTLLLLLGLEPCADFQGRPLLGARAEPPVVLAEEPLREGRAVRRGDWKLVSWQEEVLDPPDGALVREALGRSLTPEESLLVATAPTAVAEATVPWDLPGDLEDVVAELLQVCRRRGWTDTLEQDRLYSLAEDPGEERDVADRNPTVLARLDSVWTQWQRSAPLTDASPRTHLSDHQKAMLREMGYLY
jgi:arylsulfatase A-like enzyme